MMEWKYTDQNPLGKRNPNGDFTLFEGYENTRLFAVLLKSGAFEFVAGYIDGAGSIINQVLDEDVGSTWEDVTAYVDIEAPAKARFKEEV